MKKNKVSRRDFLKIAGSTSALSLLAGLGGWKYITQYEPSHLELVELSLALPRLDSVFDGLRIAIIGDIHMGGWMTRERLSPAIDMVLENSVDMILIPGDFMAGEGWNTKHENDLNDLIAGLRRLSEKTPTFAVMGNHDHWTNAAAVKKALQNINIIALSNTHYTIKRGSKQFHICGVDDVMENKDDLDALLYSLPAEGTAILIAHEPDFADISAATGRFDLQVSGHTHGGQVVIPGQSRPPILPPLGEKYYSGLYKIREMWQYTNRGVGMGRVDMRFNCPPEITLITLKAD